MAMERLSLEVKVGLVVTAAVGMVLAFLILLGEYNPFTNTYRITVTLNYAGGIKPGSDVHLAGAKVGKVDAIRFFGAGSPGGDHHVLGLELLIDKRAKELIREDSVFAVHMESLLGGKIVEITPGSPAATVLEEGAVVSGVEPPRLDDLILEAVSLVEGIKKFLDNLAPEDRERFQNLLLALSRFGPEDVDELRRIVHNTAEATDDLKAIAAEVRPELGPLLEDLGAALAEARPLIKNARGLISRLDRTVDKVETFLPGDAAATRAQLEELLSLSSELAAVADRLDRFTAAMETELQGMSKDEVERIIRQFLQQEGVTINVGTIVGNPNYPPPPEKKPAQRDQTSSLNLPGLRKGP